MVKHPINNGKKNIPVPWIRNGSFDLNQKPNHLRLIWHLAAWHLWWLCRLCCLLLLTWRGKSWKIHEHPPFFNWEIFLFRTSSMWWSMFFWYNYVSFWGGRTFPKIWWATKKQRKWDHFQKSYQVGSYPCQVGTQKNNVSLFFLLSNVYPTKQHAIFFQYDELCPIEVYLDSWRASKGSVR